MPTMDKFKTALQSQGRPFAKRVAEGIAVSAKWLRRKPRAMPAGYDAWADREQWQALFLLTFGAALACMFFVDVPAALYSRDLPTAFITVVNHFTDFGKSTWTLWPSGLVLGACLLAGAATSLTQMQHRVMAAVAVRAHYVFVAIALPGLFTALIKRVIGRGRPLAGDQHLLDAFYYIPFAGKANFTAMPSGHATAAFSALVVLGSLWPKARPFLWLYAIAVALSRVILLSHFVSDVVVGALLGAFGAILVRNAYAARGLVFYRDELGHVTPKAGPSWPRIKALARAIQGQ